MAIWLGKQYLNQYERVEVETEADDKLIQLLQELNNESIE